MPKIPVKSIWLRRAEGPNWDLGQRTVASFEAADQVLRKWSETAPEKGGYDKVDFKVTWQDGETYEGRYDLVHRNVAMASLSTHIQEFCSFHGGLWCPSHLKRKDYDQFIERQERTPGMPKKAEFLKFLEKYAI